MDSVKGAFKKKVIKDLRKFILQRMKEFKDSELCDKLSLLPSGLDIRRERENWTLGECFDILECLKFTDISILIKIFR